MFQLFLVSYFVLATAVPATEKFTLDPVINGREKSKVCVTSDGRNGTCILAKFCTADHYIAVYANIDDSELREKKQCGDLEWCCILRQDEDSGEQTELPVRNENKGPTVSEASSTACTPIESTDCPWCVTLHKGTLNDMAETGLYCMGSMIGPKVILTSASCILAAKNITMWAQVPSSGKPKQQYAVRYTVMHPKYNSGTHEYDFGLVILQEDVNWGQKNWKGACLELQKSVTGQCNGFGFDGNNQIVSTLLTSKAGGCSESGDSADVSCSRKYAREDYCIIASGSPVSCQGSTGLMGVARSSCYDNASLVGSLSFSKDWITEELKTLNVLPSNYLLKRS